MSSTTTSTETAAIATITAQAIATPTTPTLIKVNLVCEDRETGKKCLFKDLKVALQPEGNFKVCDLIEKNISLQYFLNSCMIFQPSDDDMDIMIGFFPSEEIQNQYLSIDSKTNITLKFEKIRTPSSESKKEETLPVPASNQNQISNNKNNNNNQKSSTHTNTTQHHTGSHNPQSKLLQPSLNNTTQSTSSPKTQSINHNEAITIEQQDAPSDKVEGGLNATTTTAGQATSSNHTTGQLLLGNAATASQLSNEDLNNNDSLSLSSHSLAMESEGCSQQLEPSAVSNLNKEAASSSNNNNASGATASDAQQQQASNKGFQLNRKRKVSETLDHCSESCSNPNESKDLSPCTSFTENEMPKMKKHQSAVTNDPTLSEAGETNNCFTQSMNLSLNNKFPINLYSQAGLNIGTHGSSFHAYNPLSNITNSGNFSSNGGKSNENNGINGFSFMTNSLQQQGSANNNSANNNNSSSNMSRQSRNKERTIREAIEMVTKWRDLQEEYRQKHQVKGLQEVADELNISKKVLDYYFQELRTAEFFGFDFDSNLGNKMGVLRKYIDEQKKNHEQKNKNFKITRNLQFKYRLKDYQGSSYLSNSSSNNNNAGNNNNDALSSTSSQKSKEKFQQKQQAKMDQITSLLSSSVSNGQIKVEEMLIEGENNFNFPPTANANVSGAASTTSSASTSSTNNATVAAPTCDFQKLLSKNSPNFLNFFNNTTTNTAMNSNGNSFPTSVTSGSGFNVSANNQNSNNTNNNNHITANSSNQNSTSASLNFLSSLTNGGSGFSMNPSHNSNTEGLRKQQQQQQNQSQQSQQNSTGGMDKNLLLLELLLNQHVPQTIKQEPIFNNEKMTNSNSNANNSSNNQIDSLLSLFKMFSSNEEPSQTACDMSIPTFQKSHSANPSLLNNKFQEDDYLTKKRIAVIQIRKQDE